MPIRLLTVITCMLSLQSFPTLRSYGLQPGRVLCPLLLFLLSHSVVSGSLRPHRLQHTTLPCPSPTPGACANSCVSSWWRHPTVCRPRLLPSSIFPSIRVFSNESVLRIRWPKYWSFSFNISPSNEHSGLTSFRMDWLDLLAVQGTLKGLLQHHSSKGSFFVSQLSLWPNFHIHNDYCVAVRRIRRALLPKSPNFTLPLKLSA